MLHRATQLKGATVAGLDGDIGVVDEVFIDDESWRVRYLAVKTGQWPTGRTVLVVPEAIRRDTSSDARLELGLRRNELLDGPLFNLDRPLSRRQELAYAAYYGLRPYWASLADGGFDDASMEDVTGARAATRAEGAHATPLTTPSWSEGRHVHGSSAVLGYELAASDGHVGKVEDLLIDEESWAVKQLIVDTTRWLPGGEITVPAALAQGIDSQKGLVHVNADKAMLDTLPARH